MRYPLIDIIRGVAIVGMILFHTYYALVYLFDVKSLLSIDTFARVLARVSALTFIVLGGVSFALAEGKYKKQLYKKYALRIAQIAFYALCITLYTLSYVPSQSVYFGILHFFALGFFLLLFFRHLRYYNTIVAIIIFIIYFFIPSSVESPYLFPLGAIRGDFFSADYYPIVPYFAFLLLGYAGGLYLLEHSLLKYFEIKKLTQIQRLFVFLGRNSLTIYFIHMPIVVIVLSIIFALI